MRNLCLLIICHLCFVCAQAQNPVADFTLPANPCLNQNIQIQNTSTNAVSYEWDFCQGDLGLTPTSSTLANMGGNTIEDVDIVFDGVYWYGFAVSRGTSAIIRVDFGVDVNNPTPVYTNLGNINSVLIQPTGIKIVQQSDQWYGFVNNQGGNYIVRIDFGNSLSNTSTAQVIYSTTGGTGVSDGGIDVVSSNDVWYVMYGGATNTGAILRLSTITSIPTISDKLTFNVSSGRLSGCRLIRQNGNWFGFFINNLGASAVQRLSFGSDLFSTPSIQSIVGSSAFTGYTPYGLDIAFDAGQYYLFITTLTGNLMKTNLGSDLSANPQATASLGNLSGITNTLKLRLVRRQSDWFGFTFNYNTTSLYKISFPSPPCGISPVISQEEFPEIKYTLPGEKYVGLTAIKSKYEYDEVSDQVMVSSSSSPDILFTSQNICSLHDVIFTTQNASGDIITYDWAFGDGGITSVPNPTHQYVSAGNFQVELLVTATNTCQNFVRKTLTIYNQPVADFTTPLVSPLCTNQNFVFDNTTADVGYTSVWEWSINAVPVASSEDLTYAFTSTANQEVKLKASIPGCESEKTINITTLIAGPKPDFTITGQCEDASIVFTNTSSGTVTGYTWDFDDGQTSTLVNPVNVFANPGVYDVVLTASNAAGCNNTALKQVTIYSSPQVNFMALAPPFSCSGTPTQFNDLTPPPPDSNLSSWSWNFGDTGSPSNTSTQRNPQHTYATAADYTVALTVTTNVSCSKTFQKSVTIHQTPTAAFNHSALCEDTGVTFSDAASTNQAWNWQIGSSFYFTENVEHIFTNPGNYTVIFSATGSNNCVGSTTQPVVIPTKLNVDFSTLRTCVNQEAEFTDLTNDSSDPITDVSWNFGGLGTAATTPATFIFPETGTVNVTLTVTTQSGCAYPVTKPTGITEGPLAAFTATPNTGEAPLTVQFTNTSLDANTFNWKFNAAGSASTQPSPSFIYVNAGDFMAELIARDLKSCADSTRQLIEVLEPAELNHPSPNPSKGTFTFEWKTNEATKTAIVLVDATGREVRNFEVMSNAGINRYILDITGEQPGFYILNIRYLNTLKTYKLMLSE